MGFLPATFQLPIGSSVFDLGSGTGQTDGQSTAFNAQCHTAYGAGIITAGTWYLGILHIDVR